MNTDIALATDVSGILYYVGSDNLVYKVEDVLGKTINPEVVGIHKNGMVVPISIPPELLRTMRQTVPDEIIRQIETVTDEQERVIEDIKEDYADEYEDYDDVIDDTEFSEKYRNT
jgi:hypothetical protein